MNNNRLITGIVVVGGLTALYFAFLHKGKRWAVKTIIEKGNYSSDKKDLETLDTDFLISWGKASQKGEESFFHKGKIYLTKGGRAKQ